jgi:amidophosphoribosyltransferase
VLLDLLDYHHTSNLQAGEAVVIRLDGTVTRRQIRNLPHHPCLFEWVYFARPDSFLDKVSVYKSRLRMGEHLAEKWRKTGIAVDVVMPVPESARDAALAMAQRLGVKYREGFVKNRYIGRTFIMPDNKIRKKSIRHKLNAIQLEFKDKDVLLVDDSIVRGNTSREIVQMAREAGARKVYFASCSPPLKHPCVYGIDMSTKNEFIARGRTDEQIAKEIGADYVLYQDLADLETSVREGNPELVQFCNACFSGQYPTGDVTQDVLDRIEGERLLAHSKD